MTKKYLINTLFLCAMFLGIPYTAKASSVPFTVKTGLFDQDRPDDLGLTAAYGTETVTVFRPSDTTDHFSNGVVMAGFKGYIYCQWQSSAENEDDTDTWVAYSRSVDGKTWTQPMTLAPACDSGYHSSGGWWVYGDTLVAYINMWPSSYSIRGGYTQYKTSIDGLNWSELKNLPMADGKPLMGIFEQDPHSLPSGRIIGAAHFQPGLFVAPIYTDTPSGLKGWTRANFTNLTYTGNTSREMEPGWFWRADSAVVMVFRDQSSTYRRLASISYDKGENWSEAVLTDMPDSRSKQSAGNLPDGTAFQVGNPVDTSTRIPLVVSLSKDGQVFDTAFLLRQGGSNLQARRYAGNSKGKGYSYPKSMVWQNYLYVSYSTNKEDVEYTRVPLTSLYLNSAVPIKKITAMSKSETGHLKIISVDKRIIKISLQGYNGYGTVQIYTPHGQLVYNGKMNDGEKDIDLKNMPTGICFVNIMTVTGRKITAIYENF